jgi:cytidyltransferase-like protein
VTRVYADMVGDLFHAGHVEFLRQARSLGDELVVGVHSDDDVASYKRRPILTMDERIQVVAACRYVDETLPNAPLSVDQEWLDRHRLDLVVHGDDFDPETLARYYRVALERGILRILPYSPGISTSQILDRIVQRYTPPGETIG